MANRSAARRERAVGGRRPLDGQHPVVLSGGGQARRLARAKTAPKEETARRSLDPELEAGCILNLTWGFKMEASGRHLKFLASTV